MKVPKLKKITVLEFFGGVVETAKAINIQPPSVSGWGEFVPARRAYEFERITNGALKPEYVDDQPSDSKAA